MRSRMGTKPLKVAAVAFVLVACMVARLGWEQAISPAYGQDEDPRVGLDDDDLHIS